MRRAAKDYLFICLIASGVLAGVPAVANAGLIDIIWDMSGPQMIGDVGRCRVPVTGGETKCSFFGAPNGENPDVMETRAWVSLEGGVYFSTGKNEGDTDYEAFRTFMLSFEPVVEVGSLTFNTGRVRLFHGAGLASHFLFGPDFRRFTNAGFKLRPVGVEIGDRLEVSLNIRLYPDGFGADQFGFGPSPAGDRPFEHTWGFTVGYKY